MSSLRSPPSVRRRLPTAERQLQLLEVAVRVFGQHGYVGAGLEEIAREAGISAPAMYRHYPNKKALYLAALAHTGERMFAEWERIMAEAPDALSALARIGTSYQRMMRDEPHLLHMRFRALNATDEPEVLALAIANHKRAQKLAGTLASRADAEGILPAGLTQSIVVAGFMAWGALTDVTHHLGLHRTHDVYSKALSDLAAAFSATSAKRSPRVAPKRRGRS